MRCMVYDFDDCANCHIVNIDLTQKNKKLLWNFTARCIYWIKLSSKFYSF